MSQNTDPSRREWNVTMPWAENFIKQIRIKFSGTWKVYVSIVSVLAGTLAISKFGKEAYKDIKTKREDYLEKEKRKKMLGNNVAQGLAWSHYSGYLQYVLPDLKQRLKDNDWYKQLPENEKGKVSMKLYELIPRKCTIKMPLVDSNGWKRIQNNQPPRNIEKVSEIKIDYKRAGNDRDVKIPIYGITEGNETYYCMCECPAVLSTIVDMDNIQLSELYKSTSNSVGFTSDERKTQLSRFYYAMNSILNWDNQRENKNCQGKSRLLMFNDVDYENVSEVLLSAVKEDLQYLQTGSGPDKRLMVDKLDTMEEMKDVYHHDYHAFIAFPDLKTKPSDGDKKRYQDLLKYLEMKGVRILKEEDTLGKDMSEKLRFAATKCRWIVFLEREDKPWSFMSSAMTASLEKVLKERKVQTIAVVHRRIEKEEEYFYVPDKLRWVACLPYSENEYKETICSIIQGQESKTFSKDLFINKGDIAVGLAWGYAANYLNKVLPEMLNDLDSQIQKVNSNEQTGKCSKRLYILIPKSCKTPDVIEGKGIEQYTTTKDKVVKTRSYKGTIYKVEGEEKDDPAYFVGQFAAPLMVLFEMKETGFLTKTQMEAEAKKFEEAVRFIMKTAFPEKAKDLCEFIFYDDEEEGFKLSELLRKTIN